MRERHAMLVASFSTTAAAMAMERLCREQALPGRLIPVPRCITADCGMAWCAPVESREALETAVARAGAEVTGWYEVLL